MDKSPAGRQDPVSPPSLRFDELPLSKEARAGLASLGYEVATGVQASAFGPVMAGNDVVVQSKTGTGKTTAFGLPLMERIKMDGLVDPQALVLCPTRELAVQVSEELAELGDAKGVRVLPIYGGTPMGPQLAGLKSGCDVIVGTPGRVLDHIRRRSLRLVHVHVAVLDEADEMLSMGFWDEVTAILDKLPEARQTLLFSATLPDQIRRAAAKYLRNPERLDLSRDELTVEGITNVIYERDDRLPKPRNLLYVLEVERPDTAIIFCNTRDDTGVVAAYLRRQGLDALALSGELGQKERERIMGRMKRGELQYLVATDIAARGIDISDLSHVVNYNLPDFTEVYIHRVGRTGRIGKTGTAVSLVGGRDEMTATELERNFGIKFEKRVLPTQEELDALRARRLVAQISKVARETEITGFITVSDHIRKAEGGAEVVAYLLKRYFTELEEQREATAREEEARRTKEADAEVRQRQRVELSEEDVAPKSEDKRRRSRRNDGPKSEPRGRGRAETSRGSDDVWRLFVNRGTGDGYDEAKVTALLNELAGVAGAAMVRVELRRSHAFVESRAELAQAAVDAAGRGITREDRPLIVERARTR